MNSIFNRLFIIFFILSSSLVLSFAIGTIAAMRFHIQIETDKAEAQAAMISVDMVMKVVKGENISSSLESQDSMVSKLEFVIRMLDQLG